MRTALTILLALLAPAALAEPAAAPAPAPGAAWCQANPERCAELQQRARDKCAADPERCAAAKERLNAARQRCAEDPKACEARQAKWRERLQERRAAPAPQP
ncbi:hypothetical protein EZJ19_15480 [Parasulfuritortus cantonensis]|uniref:Uncharacterized protein n=1 Tax=Parasulfuritortus cantonensis TaxID=2528202 RepID=A0A4R1B0P5_9PROT|nr:hypothetical protein [Parasulfuritortus cantonensis]TCJ11552.1 hypothetical protein EZJ19_15480 [Parasulfuritortus cantonensis]